MSHQLPLTPKPSPLAGAPTWVRVLQAAFIGLVAGLAMHVLFSMVTVRGETLGQGRPAPSQCKKANPSRDAVTPRTTVPKVSGLGTYMLPRALDGGTIPFKRI